MLEFFAPTLIIILTALSPGPDFAIITKNSLLYSRRAGIYTALGVSCSLLIHSCYCMFGLAIVISKSLLVFSFIKYLGAAYLIYIGIKSLFSKTETAGLTTCNSLHQPGSLEMFRQGLLCNLLNPKAIMFILAFFTLFIKPQTSIWLQTGYSIEITLIHFLWFSWLAVMITHRAVRASLAKFQSYIVKAMGALLLGFGVRIAFMHQVIK